MQRPVSTSRASWSLSGPPRASFISVATTTGLCITMSYCCQRHAPAHGPRAKLLRLAGRFDEKVSRLFFRAHVWAVSVSTRPTRLQPRKRSEFGIVSPSTCASIMGPWSIADRATRIVPHPSYRLKVLESGESMGRTKIQGNAPGAFQADEDSIKNDRASQVRTRPPFVRSGQRLTAGCCHLEKCAKAALTGLWCPEAPKWSTRHCLRSHCELRSPPLPREWSPAHR